MRIKTPVLFSLLCAALLWAVPAWAEIKINWFTPANSILQLNGSSPAPSTWIAQLVYAGPDGKIAAIKPSAPFTVGDDDVILHSQKCNYLPSNGRIVGSVNPIVLADNSLAGRRVYSRVFNLDYPGTANTGNPTATPVYYGVSALSAPMQISSLDPTTILLVNQGVTVNRSVTGPVPPGTVVISRPSGSTQTVNFSASTGTLYFLETRPSLLSGNWAEISGPLTGNGAFQIPVPSNLPSPSYLRVRAE